MNLLFEFDKENKSCDYLIGTDEAGRGPLAGPVVAAAVYFPVVNDNIIEKFSLLNDSKKLTHQKREILYQDILEHSIHAITVIEVEEIEKINILQSSLKAMKISCTKVAKQLNEKNTEVFVDGNKKIPQFNLLQKTIVKGDGKSASIAAASILAKVFRDNLMCKYAKKYPEYFWEENKGYGTEKHIEAIKKYGITPLHRKSFLKNILNEEKQEQLSLF